jgi:cell division septation protein DedD
MQNPTHMATVPEHIKNLLFEQDCVVIPDFGGFIANFHAASMHANGSVLPPRRRLLFNEVLKFDDGLLSSYVAVIEHRSREEALQRIRAFTEHLKAELRRTNQYRFEHLGSFTLNREGKLQFEPDERLNFYGESYGCVPVFPKFSRKYDSEKGLIALPIAPISTTPAVLEPDVEEVPVMDLLPSTSRRNPWLTAAAACGLLMLSVAGYQMVGSSGQLSSSLNPLTGLNMPWNSSESTSAGAEKLVKPSPTVLTAAPIPAPVAQPEAGVAEPVKEERIAIRPVEETRPGLSRPERKISAPQTRYYVIVGGFKKATTANKLKRDLLEKGYDQAQLVLPKAERGLVKVAVDALESSEEAAVLAKKVGTRFGNAAWVLKQ